MPVDEDTFTGLKKTLLSLIWRTELIGAVTLLERRLKPDGLSGKSFLAWSQAGSETGLIFFPRNGRIAALFPLIIGLLLGIRVMEIFPAALI